MRIESPRHHERFGAVRIHEATQVIELDSGLDHEHSGPDSVSLVTPDEIRAVQGSMAIVVPTLNERRKVIEGVLSGIPHDCLIILVSGSDRSPVDRYEMETESLSRFCDIASRRALMVHQRDPGLGKAMESAGYPDLLDDGGLVRMGKGEAVVIGLMLAELAGRDVVGFVDADNYVPGAVHEYVTAYAAGIHLAPSPYSMVRISWHSKPKVVDGRLAFNRWGRTTQVTNRFLNGILSTFNGFGTEIITTGNAGEHAMTMELARHLRIAAGYAVEPFQFVELFEQYGGAFEPLYPELATSRVDVYQVETRNPHFHEDKGIGHVESMRLEALNSIYHSPVCPDLVRTEILELLEEAGALAPGELPGRPRIYPPPATADPAAFERALGVSASFRSFG